MFDQAKWIWPGKQFEKNQRANFLFRTTVSDIQDPITLDIGCETKYWLFVNDVMVVFDGGLFRESLPECGYYDTVDITKYIRIGYNEIKVHAWYYGNGGRNNTFCSSAGLILSCEKLSIFSNENTVCEIDRAYKTPSSKEPTFLYGGNHTLYDATVHPFSLCPVIDTKAGSAVVLGVYGDKPWGELHKRTIPLLFFSDRCPCEFKKSDTECQIILPYAMHFSPYFRIKATEGTVIEVHSDRYEVNGGPGGESERYYGHRVEYIAKDGEQEFEMLDWIFGEKITFSLPENVEVLEVGYRESGYDSKVMTSFACDDPEVNILFEKCLRTLKVCMRENYMDCPDRERGQWIGDVSVQAPQVVYLLDQNGLALLKKAICDFIYLRKGDRLVGNVPGDHCSELPSQSLNAISEHGLIATYYLRTNDKSVLEMAFEPAVKYLMLWETDDDGVVLRRNGDWEWYDHLFNCDKTLLNICWYYSALRFARTMSKLLRRNEYDSFINNRMSAIERVFDSRYWKEQEKYYSSGSFVDDRANAMVVLSGLCAKDKYPHIRFVLTSVFNSTPYMENYVLLALCEMGYKQDAFLRMMCRYQPLIHTDNSTLWEDFFHLGTRNHAWSGSPATILLRYFVGIAPDLSVTETDISPLKSLKCTFVDCDGKTVVIEKTSDNQIVFEK